MNPPEEFFVGWRRAVTPRLGRFLAVVGAGLLGGSALLALALGAAADDPAGPGFAMAPGGPASSPAGDASLVGLLTLAPYPLLHVPPDAAHPRGQAILLAEDGKRGAAVDPSLAGRSVAAKGFRLSRGDIEMLVLEGPPTLVVAAPMLPVVEPLGRWRVTGEICDGKCAAGGMRPGSGLGHRACATLCLDGELPAIFVTTAPVAGSAFLLLGAADGSGMPPALRDRIGLRTTLEGALERRGTLLVFLADGVPLVTH